MHGIPEGERFQFLVGRTLEQLRFSRHQLTLSFDQGVWISVEGDLGVREPGGAEAVVQDSRSVAASLLSLLDDRVGKVRVNDASSLSIIFGRGAVVRLIDHDERYEAFQIGHGERLIVV